MSEWLVCPYCKEEDFDGVGLKYHLLNYCVIFQEVNTLTRGILSEAKEERIHLYTCRKTEEDKLSCPLCAYAEGRADGLRHELERLFNCVGEQDYEIIEEVLEADGEGK